jgi:ABC-type uncharacterized transport system involved in gliding motility auxiliary subunit
MAQPMNNAFMKQRQTKFGAFLAAYLLVVLAILGAVNYLANRYNKTKDFTESKLFSLSDQSVKIAKNLQSEVKIYYFERSDQWNESRYGPSPKDQLNRYSNLSPKINVQFVDPVRTPKLANDMKVTTMGTVIIETAGRREEAKGLSEEEITNAMIRALKPDKRTACFLTGHGEHDIENTASDGFSAVKQTLESSNFLVKTVSLLEKQAAVPPDCTVLLIGGPKNDLISVETDAIKKFVEGGGRAMFMLNPLTKGVNTAALGKMLEDWSVSVNDDLVVDLSGIGQLFGTDEFSPLVTKYENHVITREMRNTAALFPLARSVTPGASKGGVTVEKLFGTTSKSYAVKDFKTGKVDINPKVDTQGPLNLGLAGVYSVSSSGGPDAPKAASGRFIVTGSSRFVTNSTLGFPGGNKDLFLNMMNWLTNDEDLIAIRPKDVEDRRLSLNQAQMGRILYTNVFGLPLLIIALGTWVWWKRR